MQIHPAILRQAPLGDVHVRHHFEARDDGGLQKAQLRRHRHFVQNAIDAITNAQIVFERLDMNVRGALDDRLANDLVDELHHGSFGVVRGQVRACFPILQHFESTVGFQNLIECFRADAVERFHGAQNLPARHQHPFRRLF